MTPPLTACDLFCGCGGFRLALENLGVDTVFSCDIDRAACVTYEANFGDLPCGDIRKVDTASLPDFDILTAGFPCQPFSTAGKKEGFKDEIKGTLFFDVVRFIRDKKPQAFLLKNVPGLIHIDEGRTLATILKTLKGLGYFVHQAVLNAHDFGVPQHRKRWFCVGFRDFGLFNFPKGTRGGMRLRDIIEEPLSEPVTNFEPRLKQMIDYHFSANVPLGTDVYQSGEIFTEGTRLHEYGVISKLFAHGTLEFRKPWCDRQASYYTCTCADAVAPTMIRHQATKFWDLKREVSSREAARMQGYPDSFKLPCSHRQNLQMMGNSVAVPCVQAILDSIIKAL